MELYHTDLHYILWDHNFSLWCNRSNGKLEPKKGDELNNAWNPVYVGQVYGLIGKVKLHPDSEWRLLLIKQRSEACKLADSSHIYKINKIVVLPLTVADNTADLALEFSQKQHFGNKKSEKTGQSNEAQISLRGTWNTIKTAAENVKSKKKEIKDKEKFEKRILEELLKMYNDSDYFYYSDDFDVTNSLQRQNSPSYDKTLPLWKRADERFFWNKHMLLELMETEDPLADHWMIPIIQGFVQMETCIMDFDEDKKSDMSSSVDFPSRRLEPLGYNISIISRRSRHRAGTRSRKRGINALGACANYVETEQIIEFSPHLVSFVQVRGSIPVFWSQTGFKYRPPPKLDKDPEESHQAFLLHIKEQLELYQMIVIISLAELTGKEYILGDAYMSHVLRLNSPDLTYVTFDFHEYCRGMRFENVSMLTDCIKDTIKDMRYCWVDNKGVICEQKGVFRVNCVDCLDRTNVVQTAVARIVMETQFRKLGLLPPEESLPSSCRKKYQQIWANNGDVISRQYAGTAALKGDYTRTGERKFTGLMKDGVNSASRYYLRFRDAYRQAAIDLTLGQPVPESIFVPSSEVDEIDGSEISEKEENLKMIIEDCKKMLIVEPELCLGGWALVNADPVEGDSDQQDMDMILLLSQRSVYVAWYDDEAEQVTRYQRIFLEDVDKIEIGMEPAVFKSKHPCLRLTYHHQEGEGLIHMFRIPANRFFNNKSTAVQTNEEARDSLKVIAETFKSAQLIMSMELEVVEKPKLEKKKATVHPEIVDILKQQHENSLASISLPRDISADMNSSISEDTGMNTLLPQTTAGKPDVATVRSKSPLDFLNSLPKPNLTSATARFSFPKPNLKVNLQNLNLMKRIKRIRDGDDKDDDEEVDIMEETSKDVVLDSCGILASSPNQIILSSMHLKAENKRNSSHLESSNSRLETGINSEVATPQSRAFNFDEMASNTFVRLDLVNNMATFKDREQQDEVDGHCKQDITKHTNASWSLHDRKQLDREGVLIYTENKDDEEDYTMKSEEVQAILDKCHQLHHPHMKTSLSDTTLSMNILSVTDDSTVGSASKIDNRDSGIVTRFKMKMSNLSKPTSRLSETFIPGTNIRKSQRALEVFEQLMKEQNPAECKTCFMFI